MFLWTKNVNLYKYKLHIRTCLPLSEKKKMTIGVLQTSTSAAQVPTTVTSPLELPVGTHLVVSPARVSLATKALVQQEHAKVCYMSFDSCKTPFSKGIVNHFVLIFGFDSILYFLKLIFWDLLVEEDDFRTNFDWLHTSSVCFF